MSLGTRKMGAQNNPQVRTTASQQWPSIFVGECLQGSSWNVEKHLKTLWLTFPIIPDITYTGESNFHHHHDCTHTLKVIHCFCSSQTPATSVHEVHRTGITFQLVFTRLWIPQRQGYILPTCMYLEPSRVPRKFYFLSKCLLAGWLL